MVGEGKPLCHYIYTSHRLFSESFHLYPKTCFVWREVAVELQPYGSKNLRYVSIQIFTTVGLQFYSQGRGRHSRSTSFVFLFLLTSYIPEVVRGHITVALRVLQKFQGTPSPPPFLIHVYLLLTLISMGLYQMVCQIIQSIIEIIVYGADQKGLILIILSYNCNCNRVYSVCTSCRLHIHVCSGLRYRPIRRLWG